MGRGGKLACGGGENGGAGPLLFTRPVAPFVLISQLGFLTGGQKALASPSSSHAPGGSLRALFLLQTVRALKRRLRKEGSDLLVKAWGGEASTGSRFAGSIWWMLHHFSLGGCPSNPSCRFKPPKRSHSGGHFTGWRNGSEKFRDPRWFLPTTPMQNEDGLPLTVVVLQCFYFTFWEGSFSLG